jgi:tetratricopeptide (TPR) repeat protein
MSRYILKGNRRWDKGGNKWYNYGNFLINEHKIEEAIEAYTKGIKLDPKNSFLFYGLGSACQALNKYSDAIANYSKTIELDPKNADALEARASVYVSLGLSDKLASRDYQQTIESKETIEKESETDIRRECKELSNFPSCCPTTLQEDLREDSEFFEWKCPRCGSINVLIDDEISSSENGWINVLIDDEISSLEYECEQCGGVFSGDSIKPFAW